jgi:hypothetical protein
MHLATLWMPRRAGTALFIQLVPSPLHDFFISIRTNALIQFTKPFPSHHAAYSRISNSIKRGDQTCFFPPKSSSSFLIRSIAHREKIAESQTRSFVFRILCYLACLCGGVVAALEKKRLSFTGMSLLGSRKVQVGFSLGLRAIFCLAGFLGDCGMGILRLREGMHRGGEVGFLCSSLDGKVVRAS